MLIDIDLPFDIDVSFVGVLIEVDVSFDIDMSVEIVTGYFIRKHALLISVVAHSDELAFHHIFHINGIFHHWCK